MVGLAPSEPAPRDGSFWAITSYFNPAGYRSRLENYRTFRAHLTVPLVTAEASFDGRFALDSEDAEILVQRCATDVMWQKERLLNAALAHLPEQCKWVAWLDCDLIFRVEDWPARAQLALADHGLVQLFSQRLNLAPGCALDQPGRGEAESNVRAVADKVASGTVAPRDLEDANAPVHGASTAGLAWAARREVLDRHGLYDSCVLGTGDRAILCAALGEPGYASRAIQMTEAHRSHYERWAAGFFASVKGRVGCVEGQLLHLWHGDLRARRYGERSAVLARHGFDPLADIAIDGQGCWRWNSDKPELHAWVRQYFDSRREDGEPKHGDR